MAFFLTQGIPDGAALDTGRHRDTFLPRDTPILAGAACTETGHGQGWLAAHTWSALSFLASFSPCSPRPGAEKHLVGCAGCCTARQGAATHFGSMASLPSAAALRQTAVHQEAALIRSVNRAGSWGKVNRGRRENSLQSKERDWRSWDTQDLPFLLHTQQAGQSSSRSPHDIAREISPVLIILNNLCRCYLHSYFMEVLQSCDHGYS